MAPFAFGLAIEGLGARTLWLSSLLGLASFAALMVLQPRPENRGLPSSA